MYTQVLKNQMLWNLLFGLLKHQQELHAIFDINKIETCLIHQHISQDFFKTFWLFGT